LEAVVTTQLAALAEMEAAAHAARDRLARAADAARSAFAQLAEAEGKFALPHHEFGLDVVALAGSLRYSEHKSVPEIHRHLVGRGLAESQRTVTNLIDRYDELLAVALADDARLNRLLAQQGKVVLAIDGLQPDVGHEVLWVLRDCLSGEILLAKSLLSARHQDLAGLLGEVRDALTVPIAAVVSDGQHSIRKAVAKALPEVAHQLCHFHYLREAARPIYEADRNAKKRLTKQVRGVRKLERAAEGREDDEAEVIKGYCSAVRSALTDDGRPPLDACCSPLGMTGYDAEVSAARGRPAGVSAVVSRVWFNPNLDPKWSTVPGLVAILTTLMGVMVTGLSVARERELGTFDQLLVSPLSPTEILIGKSFPALLIGTAQATGMVLVGVLVFGVPFRGSVLLLYAAMEAYLLA
jgi:hypothetical protein